MDAIALVEPVRRSRISQQIVAQICQLIRDRRVQPGDRLPPERELAEQLQVSRSSLREALRTLEIAGLVESRHGGGTYVRDVMEHGVSPLALVLYATGDSLGDLWEMRLIFEPEIAARAALRATPDDLSALAAVLDRQAAHVDSEDLTLQIDRDFHRALARASHNAVALRVIELIGALLRDGRGHFVTSLDRRQRVLIAHQRIVDGVYSGQPQEARAAMFDHLQEVEANILGTIVEEDDQSSSTGRKIPV
ncbi:MAG: FadR/GntR family transcriptional regulator [Thermomicrobiales bacterium]